MTGKDERSVSLQPYREEAAAARARIGMIIDRIQYRLSPSHLIGEASDAVGEHVADKVEDVRRKMQRNPIAVGFIGGLIGMATVRRVTRPETRS